MSLSITSRCIHCDTCVPVCPNRAISFDGAHYRIEPRLCTECAGYYDTPQCEAVCPVGGIVRTPVSTPASSRQANRTRRDVLSSP
ncbi:MAG: YfhL family 4Fe-4S dicluster ferredoxin [Burkholderiaceae bacterium]|nr:YfhL family 4Fe-4S dicluster ferredoxin [Burkholderiaceae bacterium]